MVPPEAISVVAWPQVIVAFKAVGVGATHWALMVDEMERKNVANKDNTPKLKYECFISNRLGWLNLFGFTLNSKFLKE